MTAANRVRPAAEVLVQKLPDGDSVLLHMGSEVYFGLDEVGTHMWHSLATSESIDEAVVALTDTYDVAPDRLEADLRALIARLLDAGLMEVADE